MKLFLAAGTILVATSGAAYSQTLSGSQLSLVNPGTSTFANDSSGPRISVFPVTPTTADPYLSPDGVQFGGLSDVNGGSSVTIRGAPYGYYDTGTLLSIVATSHSIYNARAGINSGYSGYPAGLQAVAQSSDFNSVNLYNQTMALAPRFVVSHGVGFTTMQIQFANPLTPAQISQLRRSMWLTTNLIDPTMAHVVNGATAATANSGDSFLTLSGTVGVPVGSYIRGFHAGINGPTVTVTSVSTLNGNTIVGLSSPLVDGGTDANPITSYPAGTSYGFMTYSTAISTLAVAAVGSSTLTISGAYTIPTGTVVPATNWGIMPGTTVTASSINGNTTVVTLSSPLTASQNGSSSYPVGTTFYLALPYTWPAGQHIPTVTYGTTITGWDNIGGTSININAWTVPGSHRPQTGQIPSNIIDPSMPYTTPTVYVGTPTTSTINNWVQSYDPSPLFPASATPSDGEGSRIQQFEGLELDQWNLAKKDYDATFRGLTIGYTPLASVTSGGVSHGVKPTTDSYDLQLAGDMPTLLRFTGGSTANYILGESVLVKGNGGVQGAAGNTGEMFEHSAFMDGGDNFRLVDWLQKDSSTVGAAGGSMHLGLMLNGSQGTVSAPQSQIMFNVPGYGSGSIGMFSYSGSGLSIDTVGNAYVSPNDSLILKTASNTNGGAIASDSLGDLMLGTRTAGAQTISTSPLVAQNGLTIQGGAATNMITSSSMLVKSNAGVTGASGLSNEMFEHNAYMDGIDNFRLVDWLQKDTAAGGASGGSMRLGLILNGSQGAMATPQSQLVFNVPGYGVGSIGMLGYSGSGLSIDVTGNTYVSPNDSLVFKTASNINGGAVASDSVGDLMLGTRTSGAQVISTSPLVAQNGLTIQGSATSNYITASSMLVKANGGVSGAVGNTGELFEQSGFIDGANNMRLVDWLQQDSSTIGAAGGSMHLGLIVDGAQGAVGRPQSQIVFDPAGFGTGSIGLMGYGNVGMIVNNSGIATITSGGSLDFQTGSGTTGTSLQPDSLGNIKLNSAIATGGGIIIPRTSTIGINAPMLTASASSATVNVSSATLGWNCSNGGGEACLQVSGDAGSYNGFSVYQDTATNQLARATKIFGIDRTGTETILNAFYAGASIYTGPNASLVLRTPSSANGGTISSDNAGDVVLGSGLAGGRVIAVKPIVLASSAYAYLPATGTVGTEMLCTDCLKPGEAGGAGTGMMVFDDGHSSWVSMAGTPAAH